VTGVVELAAPFSLGNVDVSVVDEELELTSCQIFRQNFLKEKQEHPWASDAVIARLVGDHLRKEKKVKKSG
jgi:hypothetical protein